MCYQADGRGLRPHAFDLADRWRARGCDRETGALPALLLERDDDIPDDHAVIRSQLQADFHSEGHVSGMGGGVLLVEPLQRVFEDDLDLERIGSGHR